METQLVIFDATAECRKSFMKCQKLPALMKGKWAENRLADFNLWASGLGASARNRASLDARLALRSDTRDTIANLLRLLNTVVVKCIALGIQPRPFLNQAFLLTPKSIPAQPGKTEGEAVIEIQKQRGRTSAASPQAASARSFSPWPDDSSSDSLSDGASDLVPDTSFSEAMKDVDLILDQLARIAVVIRRSGTRSRLQKADRMFNPDDYQELNTHLTSVILSRAPSALSLVQSQLINGNLKRRHRFLYAQRHSTGLGLAPPPVPAPKTTASERASESIQLEAHVQNKSEIVEKSTDSTSQTAVDAPAENSHNPSVRTGTSASGVTDLRELPQNSVPSQGATTQMSTTVIKLDYPYPPKMNDDALVFRCPCCCQVLPAMMADKNRWKKHIAEDVCPYSCIIPGCPKLNILYIKKDDWKKHLLKDHDNIESWICFACNENVQFTEEAAFVAHLSQEHRDAITLDEIPTLKTACKRSTPAKIICCPLCYWPAPEDGEVDKAALIDHIAEEVHVFSLRSLPWGPDDEDYDKVRFDSATAKVRGWLELELDDVPEASIIPEAEKRLPNHYFHRNEYFAASMESSDGSGIDSDDTMKRELELLRKEGPPLDSEHDTMMHPRAQENEEIQQVKPADGTSRDEGDNTSGTGTTISGDSTFGSHATIFVGDLTSPKPLPTVNNAAHADGPRRHVLEIQQDPTLKEREKILTRLYISPYEHRKNRIPDRTRGTCEWFVAHKLFREWQESKQSTTLWVSADPGCGKSVLAKHLIDSVLLSTASRTTCYFFFKDDFEDQKSVVSALCSILHQLFKQKHVLLSDAILEQFEIYREEITGSFGKLWNALLSVAEDGNAGEIVCLLDAIDECEDQGRFQLARALSTLYNTGRSFNLKFLLTSRPYGNIRHNFQPLNIPELAVIHLSGESDVEMIKISQEIDAFIQARVQVVGERLKLRDDEQDLLLRELMRVPNRTYLWVHLTLDLIETDLNLDKTGIVRITSRLPNTVEEAYERILSRSRNLEEAKKLLHIVVAAARPLTLNEMNLALTLRSHHQSYSDLDLKSEERFRENLRDLCGLFVAVINSRIYLFHQTAKEFLVQNNPANVSKRIYINAKWKHSLWPQESHRILTEICIWHLLFAEFEDQPPDGMGMVSQYTDNHVFLDYSAKHWTTHLRESALRWDLKSLPDLAYDLLEEQEHRSPAEFHRPYDCILFRAYDSDEPST
ncbi:hypothetical protein THARTR1_11239 [Trichoderma harzianum]|uniref:Uncharacterized protein n=1 Tax=Trichoderma harzianum TaxID=5544 RepID=A0A2K0T5E0_TRIHA|nr:hypothetical protein THARTR1_11239 [Trichoderma harzianum]